MLDKIFKSATKFENALVNPNSTEFEVNNWTISEFIISKLVPVVGVHPFPLNEQMLMTATVCKFKPELIFEWGTNIGKSARIFYEITKAFEIKSEINSIDLPDEIFHNEHPKKNRGKLVKQFPEVKLHQADGIQKSLQIIDQKKPKGKVLFFVDGDHSYESVKKELEIILAKVPNVIVLLHDTFFQSLDSNYNIGPFKAINDVLNNQTKPYKKMSTNMGLPGMTLIYE